MRKLVYPLVAALCLFANYSNCLAQTLQDMANAKAWYNNFIGYYNNNKKNFDNFLGIVKKNKAQFQTKYLDEYNQNVNLLNEQYKTNVTPFQKLLTDKAINDKSVEITKDKNQQQLLTWFKDMDTKSKTLYGLAQQINALKS